ncbi:ABC transporter permease [Streptomyces rapamycinicus]|uniref:Sulfate ABC transporter permease n=2 Tax=Streptomyces rapamycinicus TaxID=1226757 RepID=A0A0A0NBN1_STRRN|nr:ABC transporter permease [Streptomyces rapamycinicus]AGP54369.1 sulfate ABC transporter permease [Streptomyces rapamycinicus NRRL 5491]MBB4781872.1 NitT/TauT family transport system permease protein [Streptomyces rapamycinicus]RLV73485.1 sulfate ABC transporter permease [Streptomyces rapamycinicus NRRL 5491]UTO62433.1 ABC transporter permease [Streptomyces rapamycinicus]UTP30388.1 ABC transporter permease [Streptomyces rapamycinicus NRRL 5491]
MASSKTTRGTAAEEADGGKQPVEKSTAKSGPGQDLAGLEAGLDALDAVQTKRVSPAEVLVQKVLPPIVAVAFVLALWKVLVVAKVTPDYKLPDPGLVWDSLRQLWLQGELLDIIWTSVSRGLFGFLIALAIATPLGLVVARVKFIRAGLGPILSGLQSLPSVAWVPPAVIWLGLNDQMMYTVILLGAVPSIANGLVAGIDQVPPLFLRAGRTLGARGLVSARHILLPAALPGYVAGLKQGWAFSWRSLMAAEIIAKSPDLGLGLGQYLENQRNNSDMAGVLLGILLILVVGIAIELLIFAPIERRVLRSRGLLASTH